MASACRSFLRSSSQLRSAAARLAGPTKSARPHLPFSPPRLLRCPVEMSCCVESLSLMPMHSATASALMTSLLSVITPGFSSQGNDETR